MLPVRLRFSGLRSYRSGADIDFANLDLFAIIGDTGAGKSTIIEALCLALYARKSWSGGASISDLIADGEDVMRIEFEFVADDHPWRVTRARHRNSSAPIDKLESLDRSHPHIDQARPVTDKITELIGLNLEQFTRAVVMPQGRFDELLRASETERNKILASILGHGDLETIQAAARAVRDRITPVSSRLQGERSRLPDDPAAARLDAELAVTSASKRLEFLQAREEQLKGPAARLSVLNGTIPELSAAVNAARAFDGDPIGELDSLIGLHGDLAAQRAAATRAAERARARISDCDAQIALALGGFTGRDAVLTAHLKITESANELPGDLEQHRADSDALAALEANPPCETVDARLVTNHQKALARCEAADTSRQASAEALSEARAAWARLGDARQKDVAAREAAAEAARLAEEAHTLAATAQSKLDDLDAAVTEAAAAVRSLEQANLVAAVSAGHQPGDDCPVCTQTLPDTFTVTDAEDLTDAKAALDRAQQERNDAASRAQTALGQQTRASSAEDSAATAAERAAQEATSATTEAAELGVDPDAADEATALASLITAEDEARSAYAAADSAERAAKTELDAASATHQTNLRHFAAQLTDVRNAVQQAQERIERHAERCRTLPSGWVAAGEPLTAATLNEIAKRLTVTLSEVDRLDRDRNGAATDLHTAEQTLERASTEISDRVVRPGERLLRIVDERLRAVARAASTANASAGALTIDPVSIPECTALAEDVTADQLAELTVAARTALSDGAAAVAAADGLLAAAGAARDAAAAEVAAALDGTGCDSTATLMTEIRVASDELARRRVTCAETDEQAAKAESIDAVLRVLVPLHENFEVLVAALANKQFVDHLLNIREAELLAEASRRLKDITGGRFAFAAEFGIVSVASGLVRSPDALSGGERFQASLALALALVEIASRGGGRLDAVFVDEGFGSLDQHALDVALDTLGKVAGGGKMVALISHLRSVADYVDTVMHVTRDDVLGSSIRLLSDTERDELLSDDIRSGLTG